MMKPLKKLLILNLVFWTVFISAQQQTTDSSEFVHFDCGIIQTKQKLDKHFYASTPPTELRVNNEEFTYTTFQFGKRKNKMYLYLRILKDNVCIRKDKNVDVYFKSGEVITLKNEYPLNCNAFFAKQLKKKELQKLRENDITLIKIYTYKKNYEMYIGEVQNQNIHHYIDCLSEYKIKKTDEVKSKDIDKKIKDSEKKINNEEGEAKS
ncbi:hypothetical protein QFZ37_003168 [Chryseobacterium ginsenosidimutans]|uniref:hypothetical protein n=1 Tax=Chryseobacterium ginsenosidimutans TaxID=687846 RepID=UPI00277DD458|nr:hypothetical protein [Chryseobacterium ginsenosidimutans]MDQ0594799.1 hypothetical protein [Chryseobacterium ginsenosidimutans]